MIGGDEKEKDGEFYDNERNDVDQPITNKEKEES